MRRKVRNAPCAFGSQEPCAHRIPALTKMIMTMLKRDTTAKVGNKSKRLKAGWDNDHLLKVLRL